MKSLTPKEIILTLTQVYATSSNGVRVCTSCSSVTAILTDLLMWKFGIVKPKICG